jgi:hypothetical protein
VNAFSLAALDLTPTTIGWGVTAIAALVAVVAGGAVLIELVIQARAKRVAVRSGAFLAAVERVPNGRLLRRIPPVNVAYHIDGEDEPDASTTGFENNAANVAIALQGAEFVGSNLAAWHSVSENVMAAVAQMTHQDVNSFADLFAVVHQHGYKLASDGFFHSLRGHSGEFQVDHDFSAWQPSVPIDSNNPGIDLIFGSHGAANVKIVSDAGPALAEHFEKYPHVAAIINSDAANIPHDALYFNPAHGLDPSILDHANHLAIVDTTLTAAGLGEQTSHAIAVLHNPIDTHFPYIALAVVTGSQAALWAQGKKKGGHALEDTAAIGVGIIGGLKAGAAGGAAVGTFILPGFGTLVGGLVCGVGGLLFGKFLGVKFTQRRLRESERNAKAKSDQLKQAFRIASTWADAEWKSTMGNGQIQLTSEIAAISARVEPALSAIVSRDERRNSNYLADLKSAVDEVDRDFHARLERLGKWARINPLARQRDGDSQRDMAAWEAFRATAGENISRLGDLLAALPSQSKTVSQLAARLVDIRATYYAETQQVSATTIRKTLIARKNAVKRLNAAFGQLTAKIEKHTEPARQALFEALEEFKYFKGAAGK